MILYINRFYIAICVLRSISQYIGLMLKDVHLHVGFYYKKSVGPPVYDLFISICNWKRGKQGYKIFFEVFFFVQKENWEIFVSGRGCGHKGIFLIDEVWRYSNEHPRDAFRTENKLN